MFIDRYEEMKCLQKQYVREDASFVVVYGRRRVGKTTCISEFIKDKKSVYLLASEESDCMNRRLFQKQIEETFHLKTDLGEWEDLFRTIPLDNQERTVIVLDEFQYLGEVNSAFPSILQRIWDTYLMKQNVMLILCGSLVSMMESQALNYASPLYGRRTAQMKMRQIPYRYYKEFYPDMEESNRLKHYAVTGGIPKYIELFGYKDDVFDTIRETILNPNGFLYEEPLFLLKHEVSDTGNAFSVLSAIASGNRKISQIAAVLQISQSDLLKYLHTLMELDLVEKQVPVTENNPERSKKCIYRIKDHFISFWFRFIYPNRSRLEVHQDEAVLNKIRRDFPSSHLSYVYEDICRERLLMMESTPDFNVELNLVGRWWDNHNHEIDLVGLDFENKTLIAAECKCWINQVGINILEQLEDKVPYVQWMNEEREVKYVLFSVCGFTEDLKMLARRRNDVILIEG